MITLQEVIDLSNILNEDYSCGEFFDCLYRQDPGCLYYKLLYKLVGLMKPTLSVELGVCTGRGTAHLAGGHLDGKVYGIDPEPYNIQYIIDKCPNITIIKDRSDSIPLLSRIDNLSVDLCFIDSDHSGVYTNKEVSLWRPKIKRGGLFLFDDILLNPSMKKFWNELKLQKAILPKMHIALENKIDAGFGVAIA